MRVSSGRTDNRYAPVLCDRDSAPPFTPSFTDVIKTSERSTDVTIDEHARGEKVEAEIDAFVLKRDAERRRTEGERAAEEIWMESERRYDARRVAGNRAAWREYHRDQAELHRRNLVALVAQHEAAAEKLIEETDRRKSA